MIESHTERASTSELWAHLFGAQRGLLCVFSGLRAAARATDLLQVRQSFFTYPDDADGAVAWLDREAAAGREVYYCVHLLKQRSRKKPRAEHGEDALAF